MIIRLGYPNNMVFKRDKILVTGSSGFIGSNLLPKLKKYNVITYDRAQGKDIFDNEFEESVKKAEVVYHLAAQVNVNKSHDNPSETFIINVLGTARVVQLCLKHKKKLIYPSTAAVQHPESSPYAYTKWLAEELVRSASKSIPTVILRLYNVYGDGMNPDSGSIMYNFLTSPKIKIYGDGEQTRDFVNVNDVTNIMVDALKKKWNGKLAEVGTGEPYSANYIAGLFKFYQNKEIVYDKPRKEIKWSVANTEQLKSIYNEELTTNIEADIRELCGKYLMS